MDFYAISSLRENHAGWSLLRAQNAPLALTFFMTAFTGPNQRNLRRQQLIDLLDDVLFGLRDSGGEDRFPRSADSTPPPGLGCLRSPESANGGRSL